MATTREDFFRVLKSIEAKLDRTGSRISFSQRGGGSSQSADVLAELVTQSTTLSSIETNTDAAAGNGLAAWLASIDELLTTIDFDTNLIGDRTTSIDTRVGTSNSRLANIDTSTNNIEASTAAIDASTDGIEALLTTIDSDTNEIGNNTDGLQAELESIDANWNLLGVNQLNLAAILAAVLNNGTSGNQTTMITRLTSIRDNADSVESELQDINTELNTITTHVDGIEGALATIDQTLDDIADQQYGVPSNDVGVLTMVAGDLTKTMTISAGLLVELQALTITGETTASRTVTVSIVINGTNLDLIVITIPNGTTVILDDTKWDRIRSTLLNMKLHSTSEFRFVASAVTASESIIARIGIVRRNT